MVLIVKVKKIYRQGGGEVGVAHMTRELAAHVSFG